MNSVPASTSVPYSFRPSIGQYQESNYLMALVRLIDSIPPALLRALRCILPNSLHLIALRLALWLPGITDDSPMLAGRIDRYVALKRGLPPPPAFLPHTQHSIASLVGIHTRGSTVQTIATGIFTTSPSPSRPVDNIFSRPSPFPPLLSSIPPSPVSSDTSYDMNNSWSSTAPDSPSELSSDFANSPPSRIVPDVPLHPPGLPISHHIQNRTESSNLDGEPLSLNPTPPSDLPRILAPLFGTVDDSIPKANKGKERATDVPPPQHLDYLDSLHPIAPIAGPSALASNRLSIEAPTGYNEPYRSYGTAEDAQLNVFDPSLWRYGRSPGYASDQANGIYAAELSRHSPHSQSPEPAQKFIVGDDGWPVPEAEYNNAPPPPMSAYAPLPDLGPPPCRIPHNLNFMGYHFVVKGQLDEGGFGRVVLAELNCSPYQTPNVHYAIKITCKRHQYGNMGGPGRDGLFLERDVMMKADRENSKFLNKLYMAWDDSDHVYFVMPLHQGNLFQWIYDFKDYQPWYNDQMPIITAQLVHGLKQLWDLGYLHRDIKPANVLRDEDGNFILCDFGIAIPINHDPCLRIGSTAYMAPEILDSDETSVKYTPASDIWSLGVVLVEMHLASPMNGRDDFEDIKDPALNLLQGMLQKDPERRFKMDQILNHPYIANLSTTTEPSNVQAGAMRNPAETPRIYVMPQECPAISGSHSGTAIQEGLTEDLYGDKHAYCYVSPYLLSR
ncbi:hypothetical protein QCA50_017357 [Cerrena zonata]|uniref:Protein kinase domain-containing protein n=1 Tax=Cerrena zonata TaxID=2478898 RepID=A0AAW0FSH5_9APHY